MLYGRDREVQELLDLIIAERIVLLYSPSGAGKTSLLQAALIPALEREGFAVRPVMRVSRRLNDEVSAKSHFNRYVMSALSDLEEGLPGELQTSQEKLAEITFEKYLTEHPPALEATSQIFDGDRHSNELLIFDQFEEILTIDPTDLEAKREFFAQVGAALRDRHRWALFSMREDYIAGLDPYLRAIPTRLSTDYRLDLLGEKAAREAIQKPVQAMKIGIEFTDSAATKLVDNLRQVHVQRPDGEIEEQPGPYVEPVQLQVVCSNLWQKLPPGATRITDADVTNIGDVDTALADYYATSVAAAASQTGVRERDLREWVEDQLITEQGIRTQVLMDAGKSGGVDNAAVWRLVSAHLVRAEQRRGATWFELAHDRLIQPVRGDNKRWFDANLSVLQRDAGIWDNQHRPNGLLLRGDALSEGERWAKEHQSELTRTERDFLEASRESLRRRRRLQAFTLAALVLIGVSIVAISWAGRRVAEADQREADASKSVTDANQRVAKADQRETDANKSVTNANQRVAEADQREIDADRKVETAKKTVGEANIRYGKAARSEEAIRLAAESQTATDDQLPERSLLLAIESVRALDPSDHRISAPENQLRIALANSGGQVFRPVDGYISGDMAISPDGRWLAETEECAGRLWDLSRSDDRPRFLEAACEPIRITANGHWLIAKGKNGGAATLWDLTRLDTPPGRAVPPTILPGQTVFDKTSILSADGTRLVTLDGNQQPTVWDLTLRNPRPDLRPSERHEAYVGLGPDGKWLITLTPSKEGCTSDLDFWDLGKSNSEPIVLFRETAYGAVAFSADGNHFVTATGCPSPTSKGTLLLLWSTASIGSPISHAELPDNEDRISMLAISADGARIGATAAKITYLWDSRKPDAPIALPHSDIKEMDRLVFSGSGESLFGRGTNNSDEREFLSWQTTAHNPGATLRSSLISSSNCEDVKTTQLRWLGSICDKQVTVMDLGDDEPSTRRRMLIGHDDRIQSWDFHDSSEIGVTRANNQLVRVWSLSHSSQLANPVVYDARAVSSDGQFFVLSDGAGKLRLTDRYSMEDMILGLEHSRQKSTSIPIAGPVRSIEFSATGTRLLVTKARGTDLWNLAQLDQAPAALPIPDNRQRHIHFSPDDHWLFMYQNKNALLWDCIRSKPISIDYSVLGEFSPQGAWLLLHHPDRVPELWKLNGEEPKHFTLEGLPEKSTFHFAFSADDRWLVLSTSEGSTLWDLSPTDPVASAIRVGNQSFTDATAVPSPDGRWFFISNDTRAMLIDLHAKTPLSSAFALQAFDTTNCLPSMKTVNPPCVFGSFSPNSRWLMASSPAAGSQVVNLSAPPYIARVLEKPSNATNYATSFSPDSRWLFISGEAGTHLFRLVEQELHTLSIGNVQTAVFSSNGRWLVTAGVSSAQLWDLDILKQVGPTLRGFVAYRTAAFSGDGNWLLTFPYIWRLPGKPNQEVPDPVRLPLQPSGPGEVHLFFNSDDKFVFRVVNFQGKAGVAAWVTRLEDVVALACRTAGRNLAKDEWDQYFSGEAYRCTCPDYPPGKDVATTCPAPSSTKAESAAASNK